MNFNDMLCAHKIDPRGVIALRHRPTERRLHRSLPRLAHDRHDLFNAYQQTQTERLEKAMTQATHIASFVGRQSGKALFVGLYSINGWKPITREEFWQIPEYIELRDKYDMTGFTDESPDKTVHFFDLQLVPFYEQWKGKLVVSWSPPERAWWRRAHRDSNKFEILCIHEQTVLEPKRPQWDKLVLCWDELHELPSSWRERLSEWRGVYLIRDQSDRMLYVGSAYGDDNILGRWTNYATTGHGNNKWLKGREPQNFHFSILQLLAQDALPNRVIEIENSWKARLHTMYPDGLNDN